MKLSRIIAMILLMCCLSTVLPAAEVDRELDKRISRIERYIYGDEQSAAVADRLRQIEEDLFGRSTGQTDSEKSRYLHDFIFKGSASNLSLDMKLSFLEWKLFNKTGEGTLEVRLAEIDKKVIGNVSMEPMAFRLEQLVHLTIERGLISLHTVTIPAGTEIRLRMKKDLSSRTATKGDTIPMVVADDLFISGNILAMTKGGIVTAEVKNVRRGGRFGRTGYVNLDVRNIESMDASLLPIKIEDAGSKFDKRKIGMAAGASTLGYLVLGPIGLAGGAFIKGGEVEVPAGTELSVVTTEDRKVTGVLVPRR
ncbi:MAG TPA: hypothetical protein PKI71_09595 [Candidatus Rifleibacterium sp.]|jgi:hypothetical protein|nr:hypothetical protein [Candidatus Rifleibacterium sp.]